MIVLALSAKGAEMIRERPSFKNHRATNREIGVLSGLELLTSWTAIAFLFVLTFLIVLSVLLWRDGRFDALLKRMGPPPPPIVDKSWMLGSKTRFIESRPKPESHSTTKEHVDPTDDEAPQSGEQQEGSL
jgi:hypothetical protein